MASNLVTGITFEHPDAKVAEAGKEEFNLLQRFLGVVCEDDLDDLLLKGAILNLNGSGRSTWHPAEINDNNRARAAA